MTNLYVPRPFTTPYDTPQQRHAERYGRRRRHAHAGISSAAKLDLQIAAGAVVFWLFLLLAAIVCG